MKRLLAVAGALGLFLSLASVTLAQGYGPNPSPSSPRASSTSMYPSTTTTFRRALIFYSPSHPAPIVPSGALVVSQVVSGTATTVTYRFGVRDYRVTYFPNGSYSYVITRAPSVGAVTVSTFAARVSIGYSPARPAPIVPLGAVVVSQVASGTATAVTYGLGLRYYHVTYFPNGSYSYVITRSPIAVTTAAPSVAATTPTYPSLLPRTGGGGVPSFPALPFLFGLGLTGLGILTRKVALAVA